MDRFTALRVFRNVAELGSFAEASRQLGLSPAAISKNISELESHLGVRLFNRTTRRMSQTDAGNQYYQHIAHILDELEEADGSLSEMQFNPRGQLRVTAPLTSSLILLSKAIPRFLEAYPDLTLDLRLDDRRIDIVEEGFDIALRVSGNLQDSSLIAKKLLDLDYVVCGAPSYFERFGRPETPQDLRKHNCVQFTLSDRINEWEFKKGEQLTRVVTSGRYRVTSSIAVRDALLAGFGLSLTPLIFVRDEIERGSLVTVLNDWPATQTTLYAMYPSKRHVSAKVRAFVDFVANELKGQ